MFKKLTPAVVLVGTLGLVLLLLGMALQFVSASTPAGKDLFWIVSWALIDLSAVMLGTAGSWLRSRREEKR